MVFTGYLSNDKLTAETLSNVNLNYRLDTGEHLKFKDLFVSSANLNNIIAYSKYSALAWNEIKEPGLLDMKKVDTSNYEDEIFAFVNKFKQADNIDFYFTPGMIYYKIDGEEVSIKMVDCYDSIAIYKRYLSTKKLYDNQEVKPVNLFVLTYSDIDSRYIFNEINDKLFVDCELYVWKAEIAPKVIDIAKAHIDDKIKELKNSNTDKGTSYRSVVYIEYDKEKDYIQVTYEDYVNTMSLDYYKNNFYSLLAEFERRQKVAIDGNYFYNSSDVGYANNFVNNKNIKIEEFHKTVKYDKEGNIINEDKKPATTVPTTNPTQVDIYPDTVNIYQ